MEQIIKFGISNYLQLCVEAGFSQIQSHITFKKSSVFCFNYSYLVPVPNSTSVTVVGNQTVGQSLMLKCTVTTVKGITSRMDIVWSSNSYELKRTEGVNSYFTSDNSETYTDSYNAIQINTSDDGRVFDCKLLVNTIPLLIIDGSVTLDVIG